MYCANCGNPLADGARFCPRCGRSADVPSRLTTFAQGPTGPPGTPPGSPQTGGGMFGPPRGSGSSPVKWVAIAAAAVVLVAVAAAATIILLERGDEPVAVSTSTSLQPSSTTSEPGPQVSSTSSLPATTVSTGAITTSTQSVLGPPGDSAGEWVEVQIPGVPSGTYDIAISDQAFAYVTYAGGKPRLFAHLFETAETVELPVASGSKTVGGLDLDGLLLVWREASYNADHEVTAAHVFALRLPDGPRTEVVSDLKAGYPQVAGPVVAWSLFDTWPANPEEFSLVRIQAANVDEYGRPTGAAAELVSGALASLLGDSVWSYSLSPKHLSWETHEAIDTFDPGTYVMDFETMQPSIVSPEAFAGSIGDGTLVYQEAGQIKLLDLANGGTEVLDTQGLFPAAGPTYAVYYRPKNNGDWQILARGFTGAYEQVLAGSTGEPPWFLPPPVASPNRLAFIARDKVRVFLWEPK